MGMNSLMEEKALGIHGLNERIDSLEEKVSVFLHQDFDESDSSFEDEDDDHDSANNNLSNPMERTLFWESQEALLQEVLERYSVTSSKLRQEISRIIEVAKETDFCNCFNPNSDHGCTTCLRQRVVNLLCQKGFNASLCTSKWKHTKHFPGGKHEYIEVITSTVGRKKQIPFLVELEFRDQFEIAKACNEYRKLVAQLPECYVGKADYLNALVGVACDAAKKSMKEKKIHMGPWRKRSFMQMKWSSSTSARRWSPSLDEASSIYSPVPSGQAHESCLRLAAASAVIVT